MGYSKEFSGNIAIPKIDQVGNQEKIGFKLKIVDNSLEKSAFSVPFNYNLPLYPVPNYIGPLVCEYKKDINGFYIFDRKYINFLLNPNIWVAILAMVIISIVFLFYSKIRKYTKIEL